MKRIGLWFFLAVTAVARGQDLVPAPRTDPSPTAAPAATIAVLNSAAKPETEPPQILPDLEAPLTSPTPPPSLPGMQQLDEAFRSSSLGKAADEARLHLQWRALVNRTVHEADLVAARARAESARTDLEKRTLLRHYYTSFFERMKARADSPALRDYLQARANEHIALLAQPRVRPETAPFSGPTPAPAAAKKKRLGKAPEPELPH